MKGIVERGRQSVCVEGHGKVGKKPGGELEMRGKVGEALG
jgi:hypothetical protein